MPPSFVSNRAVLLERLQSAAGREDIARSLEQNGLFVEEQLEKTIQSYYEMALSSVKAPTKEQGALLDKWNPALTYEGIIRLAQIGAAYCPSQGLGWLVESKKGIIPMPGIRCNERVLMATGLVDFMHASHIREGDEFDYNIFDPTSPPKLKARLGCEDNDARPIIGSVACIRIKNVGFHTVVVSMNPAKLAAISAKESFMDIETRVKYVSYRKCMREVMQKYLKDHKLVQAVIAEDGGDREEFEFPVKPPRENAASSVSAGASQPKAEIQKAVAPVVKTLTAPIFPLNTGGHSIEQLAPSPADVALGRAPLAAIGADVELTQSESAPRTQSVLSRPVVPSLNPSSQPRASTARRV